MSNSRALVWMLIVALTACGQDNVTGVASPTGEASLNTAPHVEKRFDFASGAVQVDAFGYTHWYSFTAVSEPGAATAEGSWEWTGRHPDATWHASGRVICMTVIDNVAHISGIIEQTDAYWAQPPFNYAIWTVVDMGNKKKSPEDLASLFGIASTESQAMAHCVSGSFQYTPTITSGEVLVRPAKEKNSEAGV